MAYLAAAMLLALPIAAILVTIRILIVLQNRKIETKHKEHTP